MAMKIHTWIATGGPRFAPRAFRLQNAARHPQSVRFRRRPVLKPEQDGVALGFA